MFQSLGDRYIGRIFRKRFEQHATGLFTVRPMSGIFRPKTGVEVTWEPSPCCSVVFAAAVTSKPGTTVHTHAMAQTLMVLGDAHREETLKKLLQLLGPDSTFARLCDAVDVKVRFTIETIPSSGISRCTMHALDEWDRFPAYRPILELADRSVVVEANAPGAVQSVVDLPRAQQKESSVVWGYWPNSKEGGRLLESLIKGCIAAGRPYLEQRWAGQLEQEALEATNDMISQLSTLGDCCFSVASLPIRKAVLFEHQVHSDRDATSDEDAATSHVVGHTAGVDLFDAYDNVCSPCSALYRPRVANEGNRLRSTAGKLAIDAYVSFVARTVGVAQKPYALLESMEWTFNKLEADRNDLEREPVWLDVKHTARVGHIPEVPEVVQLRRGTQYGGRIVHTTSVRNKDPNALLEACYACWMQYVMANASDDVAEIFFNRFHDMSLASGFPLIHEPHGVRNSRAQRAIRALETVAGVIKVHSYNDRSGTQTSSVGKLSFALYLQREDSAFHSRNRRYVCIGTDAHSIAEVSLADVYERWFQHRLVASDLAENRAKTMLESRRTVPSFANVGICFPQQMTPKGVADTVFLCAVVMARLPRGMDDLFNTPCFPNITLGRRDISDHGGGGGGGLLPSPDAVLDQIANGLEVDDDGGVEATELVIDWGAGCVDVIRVGETKSDPSGKSAGATRNVVSSSASLFGAFREIVHQRYTELLPTPEGGEDEKKPIEQPPFVPIIVSGSSLNDQPLITQLVQLWFAKNPFHRPTSFGVELVIPNPFGVPAAVDGSGQESSENSSSDNTSPERTDPPSDVLPSRDSSAPWLEPVSLIPLARIAIDGSMPSSGVLRKALAQRALATNFVEFDHLTSHATMKAVEKPAIDLDLKLDLGGKANEANAQETSSLSSETLASVAPRSLPFIDEAPPTCDLKALRRCLVHLCGPDAPIPSVHVDPILSTMFCVTVNYTMFNTKDSEKLESGDQRTACRTGEMSPILLTKSVLLDAISEAWARCHIGRRAKWGQRFELLLFDVARAVPVFGWEPKAFPKYSALAFRNIMCLKYLLTPLTRGFTTDFADVGTRQMETRLRLKVGGWLQLSNEQSNSSALVTLSECTASSKSLALDRAAGLALEAHFPYALPAVKVLSKVQKHRLNLACTAVADSQEFKVRVTRGKGGAAEELGVAFAPTKLEALQVAVDQAIDTLKRSSPGVKSLPLPDASKKSYLQCFLHLLTDPSMSKEGHGRPKLVFEPSVPQLRLVLVDDDGVEQETIATTDPLEIRSTPAQERVEPNVVFTLLTQLLRMPQVTERLQRNRSHHHTGIQLLQQEFRTLLNQQERQHQMDRLSRMIDSLRVICGLVYVLAEAPAIIDPKVHEQVLVLESYDTDLWRVAAGSEDANAEVVHEAYQLKGVAPRMKGAVDVLNDYIWKTCFADMLGGHIDDPKMEERGEGREVSDNDPASLQPPFVPEIENRSMSIKATSLASAGRSLFDRAVAAIGKDAAMEYNHENKSLAITADDAYWSIEVPNVQLLPRRMIQLWMRVVEERTACSSTGQVAERIMPLTAINLRQPSTEEQLLDAIGRLMFTGETAVFPIAETQNLEWTATCQFSFQTCNQMIAVGVSPKKKTARSVAALKVLDANFSEWLHAWKQEKALGKNEVQNAQKTRNRDIEALISIFGTENPRSESSSGSGSSQAVERLVDNFHNTMQQTARAAAPIPVQDAPVRPKKKFVPRHQSHRPALQLTIPTNDTLDVRLAEEDDQETRSQVATSPPASQPRVKIISRKKA